MSNHEDSTVLPYHFVPVSARDPRPGDLPYREVRDGKHAGLLHHRFVAGRSSGRIVCRLTTKTPMVIGAEREPRDGQPAEVAPFLLDDRPAIPASSLRGMVSAVAEAASNSAMRILDDRVYSFRKIPGRALKNLGEVVVDEKDGKKTYRVRRLESKVRVAQRDVHGDPLETWRDGERRLYGLRKTAPKKGGKLVPWEEIEPLPEPQRRGYVRGIVRAMDAPGRDLPDKSLRKFEYFIPYDPETAAGRPTIPITDEAVERFHELCDERTAAVRKRDVPPLPYAPVGSPRNESGDEKKDPRFRLKDGDLIFFWERGGEATEIALSAIWRERVEDRDGKAKKAWRFFREIDPDLVPFHSDRIAGKLTIAEQVFGFVSEDDPPQERSPTPGLASRVRFGFGHLAKGAEDPLMERCTLRILDSPKPPSPSLYFSDVRDGASYIAKWRLDPKHHRPQGRKVYVHQRWDPESDPETWPWRTRHETGDHARPEMKARVQPLRAGLSFDFAIDFENLSDQELGLLLYALCPTPEFRHKLGMGKSLGLGTVRLEVVGLFEVDRQNRYRASGLFAPRYHRAAVERGVWGGALGVRYPAEREAAAGVSDGARRIEELRASWRAGMDDKIRNALERLGEERFEPSEVSVPLVRSATDTEVETFKWFVSYDKGRADETLLPIGPKGSSFPRLRRLNER